ncbi:MAG: four helix bundle protein [Candidatus Omnitrophica bacterium]|nr:four helix bundle protein [Candidatus Omnitrophota bacterium]
MPEKAINTFEDLEAWQVSHRFILEIYRITKEFPKDELYGLVSQLCRAALSITSNIAEGFSRYHYNDKICFYYNARGSVSEVKNCLIVSKDLKYIKKEGCQILLGDAERMLRLINGLIRSIGKQK